MSTRLDGITREWFAVQVWSGREHIGAHHLRTRGYEVFLPCYGERRQWSDRVKTVERPLFAGYIFCRLDDAVVGKILTAPGVIRILGDGRVPLPVPTSEIEAIQRIVDTRLNAEPWKYLQAGWPVRVERGPLRGIEGIVVNAKNAQRLVVSIAMLQRSVAVEIDSSWISVLPEVWLGSARSATAAAPDGSLIATLPIHNR